MFDIEFVSCDTSPLGLEGTFYAIKFIVGPPFGGGGARLFFFSSFKKGLFCTDVQCSSETPLGAPLSGSSLPNLPKSSASFSNNLLTPNADDEANKFTSFATLFLSIIITVLGSSACLFHAGSFALRLTSSSRSLRFSSSFLCCCLCSTSTFHTGIELEDIFSVTVCSSMFVNMSSRMFRKRWVMAYHYSNIFSSIEPTKKIPIHNQNTGWFAAPVVLS